MLNQELLILGILKEGPKHGYELKKRIRQIIENLAQPPISSIYYPLKILEQQKLVTKTRGREGRRPRKFTYQLTTKGEKRFLDLLEQSLLVIKRPNFDLNISLLFLPHVEARVAVRRLRARLVFLNRIKEGVLKVKQSQPAKSASQIPSILEHNLTLVQAEIDFINRVINALLRKKPGDL